MFKGLSFSLYLYISILVASHYVWSGVLVSSDLLLSYSIISLAKHITTQHTDIHQYSFKHIYFHNTKVQEVMVIVIMVIIVIMVMVIMVMKLGMHQMRMAVAVLPVQGAVVVLVLVLVLEMLVLET